MVQASFMPPGLCTADQELS